MYPSLDLELSACTCIAHKVCFVFCWLSDSHAVEQTIFKRLGVGSDGCAACRVARPLVTPAGLSLPPALQFSMLKAHNHCGWAVSGGSFVAIASSPPNGTYGHEFDQCFPC